MREDVLPLRKLSPKLLGECRQPSFGFSVARIDGVEVLSQDQVNVLS